MRRHVRPEASLQVRQVRGGVLRPAGEGVIVSVDAGCVRPFSPALFPDAGAREYGAAREDADLQRVVSLAGGRPPASNRMERDARTRPPRTRPRAAWSGNRRKSLRGYGASGNRASFRRRVARWRRRDLGLRLEVAKLAMCAGMVLECQAGRRTRRGSDVIEFSTPGGIRTPNPRFRRPMLCPVELRVP
jgi:hypothetical protein